MDEFTTHIGRTIRLTLLFLSACMAVWAVVPDLRPYAAGLALGTLASLINIYILRMKIQQLGDHIVIKGGKRVSLGFVARVCTALLSVMLAVKYGGFDLVATVAGLSVAQLLSLVCGLLFRASK